MSQADPTLSRNRRHKTPPAGITLLSSRWHNVASAGSRDCTTRDWGAFQTETLGFKVGDQVEVISERHGVELVGQTGTVTAGTKLGAAVEVNNRLRYFCVDELAAVSTLASRADLSRRRRERSDASIQPPVLVPA